MSDPGPIHHDEKGEPIRTRRSKYCYRFYIKHHDGNSAVAQWLREISKEEEFAVFKQAVCHDLSADSHSALYGLHRSSGGKILKLGTRDEQVAKFLCEGGDVWHGYPCWPLLRLDDTGTKFKNRCPPKEVFRKMENAKLITERDRRRLEVGKHV